MISLALTIILASAAVVLTFVLTFIIVNSRARVNLAGRDARICAMEASAAEKEEAVNRMRSRHETEMAGLKDDWRREVAELKAAHKSELDNLRNVQEEQLRAVVAGVRNELKLEYEESLKSKKSELSEGNKSDMESILNPLKESIEGMRKAMKDNATEHLRTTTELRSHLEQAVKDMGATTAAIGAKADDLSAALSGRPKMQGNWGETMLDDILAREGMTKGIHYTREDARDDNSRPDFILHFKDGGDEKDLIVDSKVSLTAFVRYVNAGSDEERAAALDEHIRSIRRHIDELSRKEYAKKVDAGRMFTGQVLMFMPIDRAFRLALDSEPMLWQEAYQKGVLIATEQTIMPFLKIQQITWNKFQQDTNMQEMVAAAQNMIDRVADFYDGYKDLGRKLKSVCQAYDGGITKLEDNGRSITTAAKKVMQFGVRRSKGRAFDTPSGKLTEERAASGEESLDN